ncbi:MAG: ThuA domain-containing protein [Chitinophagaceae bacterium]
MQLPKTILSFVLFIFGVFTSVSSQDNTKVDWKKVKVLVYTKNGTGYVHDNIPSAVACIKELGVKNGFAVDVADTGIVFTPENLARYTLLIFPSTNNDVFETDAQRLAFRRYIEAGGGFVGLHSVTGTERKWQWFKWMVGGTFSWHAPMQKFTIQKFDKTNSSMEGIPDRWEKNDECYFAKELFPGIKVLMAHDLSTLRAADTANVRKFAGGYTEFFPSVWYHEYDGGLAWFTALGHNKTDYQDPVYMRHVLQGIRFVAANVKKLNPSKAYAETRDTPLRF